jgi:putative sugar O-methyltransferase
MLKSRILLRIAKRIRNQILVALKYGPRASLDELINFKRAWSLQESRIFNSEVRSSISGVGSYLEICSLARERDDVYQKFRSCKEYTEILEHVSRELGHKYLRILEEDDWIFDHLSQLLESDIGSPQRYTYPGLGRIAPSYLRYAKVAGDLYSLFGSLDGFSITEIGVGYGGQCVTLKKLFEVKRYELFDLEPALGLANRYIQDARLNLLLGNHTAPTKLPNKSDLLISNYAFSELVRNLQDQYLTYIIQNSPRGYVIYNHISPPEFRSLTAKEFASKIPGAEIFREIPTTHPENVLVVWGHRKLLDEKRFVRI